MTTELKDWERPDGVNEAYGDELYASVHVRTGEPGPVVIWHGDWTATMLEAVVCWCRAKAVDTASIDAWQWAWIGVVADDAAPHGHSVSGFGGRVPSGRKEWGLTEHRAFFSQIARLIGEPPSGPVFDVVLEVDGDGLQITAPRQVDARLVAAIVTSARSAAADIVTGEVAEYEDYPLPIARLSLQYEADAAGAVVERWREYSWRTLGGVEEFAVEAEAFVALVEDALL